MKKLILLATILITLMSCSIDPYSKNCKTPEELEHDNHKGILSEEVLTAEETKTLKDQLEYVDKEGENLLTNPFKIHCIRPKLDGSRNTYVTYGTLVLMINYSFTATGEIKTNSISIVSDPLWDCETLPGVGNVYYI